MPNINKPWGLSPVKHMLGGGQEGQSNIYRIISTDANAFAIGDPVKTDTGNADAYGVSAVTLAVAGDGAVLRGVIVGVGRYEALQANPSNLDTTIIPATKTYDHYVMVCDDPWTIFEIQEFSGSGATNFTAADVGKNCNLKSGANNGYLSGWTLDDTAASATTSSRQVKLLGLVRRADNAFGSYAKWLVQLNNHEFKTAVAGV